MRVVEVEVVPSHGQLIENPERTAAMKSSQHFAWC